MTSPSYQPAPDTSAYRDLRVFDVTDQEIINTALAAARVNLPEWNPAEGHTEVLLIEALGLEVAEAIVAVNRLPGALLETLLLLAGVEKDYGAAPTATARVTCADSAGHTIPGGTRMYLGTADGSGAVVMLVEPPGLEIANGSTTGFVELIGDIFTDTVNGVPIGTSLALVSPLPFIDSIVLTTAAADGRSPETDELWRDRGVNRLSRLSEALVLPRHFEAAALEFPAVARAVAVDNTDPGTAGTGDDPGHITVAVLGDGGAVLTPASRLVIEQALEDQAIAVLDVHVVDITIVLVTMTVQVHLSDSSDPSGTSQSVRDAITGYIDPLTWSYGGTVRRNEIIALVDQVAGVDYVGVVTITGANGVGDYVLPSASAVPDATTASVTVTII
ncbi:MAG: baseplate J/gp47 family protein [Pseudonocardia sp.]|nr:baseplate J/gp47 family protein [Pseudonocardia sp.]